MTSCFKKTNEKGNKELEYEVFRASYALIRRNKDSEQKSKECIKALETENETLILKIGEIIESLQV